MGREGLGETGSVCTLTPESMSEEGAMKRKNVTGPHQSVTSSSRGEFDPIVTRRIDHEVCGNNYRSQCVNLKV